jgi:hypothetical protein
MTFLAYQGQLQQALDYSACPAMGIRWLLSTPSSVVLIPRCYCRIEFWGMQNVCTLTIIRVTWANND